MKVQSQQNEEVNPTEEDEEKFFLMYHMNFRLEEVDNLSAARRKWFIERFAQEKKTENELLRQNMGIDIGASPLGW